MNMLPKTEVLDLELSQGWLTVWFNQPARRNPITDGVITELLAVCTAIRDQRSIRGLTLRGRGGFFCAGGDLANFQKMANAEREDVITMSASIAALFVALDTLPQVTIALIEGAAMAGGLGMACCCDVAIGERNAKFAFTETAIGISPAQIARYVLRKAGVATGRRLMLTAARLDGTAALHAGLLDFVGADCAEVEGIERGIRADVLRCAPGAVAATKQLLAQIPLTDSAQIPRLAGENFTDCLRGPEGQEGVASFMEKRKPQWALEQ